jgi:hypothetical protein
MRGLRKRLSKSLRLYSSGTWCIIVVKCSNPLFCNFSVMKKALEIFAGVILIVILTVTILTMPWPVSVVMGALLLLSCTVVIVHEQIVKKRTQEKEPPGKTDDKGNM